SSDTGGGEKCVGQRAAVQDGLCGAIRSTRIHWMRGIAQKRQAAETPSRQRILIDHRILEDRVGAADEFRYVKPFKKPVRHCWEKVFQLSASVPIARLVVRCLDVTH